MELGAKMSCEVALGIGSTVGQAALGLLPDAFVRVELGGVAREAVEMQPRMTGLQRTDGIAAVDRAVVPDHDHGTAKMSEQVAQEGADLRLPDVMSKELEVEAIASPARAHRNAGDRGDAIPALAMAKQRRLPSWRPRSAHARRQDEPRFVDEDEVGAQPRGFFLISRQVFFFQSAMRSSLRSRARRSGFWTLQPSECMRRDTYFG